MNTAIVTGGIALALTLTSPAAAQMVEAGVVIRSGPVAGHVVIADPAPVYHERRVVVVDRYAPRVVVVEHVRAHRGRGWWKQHGYRPVVVYYDARHRRFYDRWDRDRRGIHEVVVYERRGRFYTADYYWRDEWRRDGWRDRDDD
ncbi:MAG TPA: hypothetical protein VHJ69_12775 [Gemmatimonadales bacterium]|jgi:hypothetical protein|nr:hypothetical protein [Gemmatimonadales bacterium]